jgi:hypothetical protein
MEFNDPERVLCYFEDVKINKDKQRLSVVYTKTRANGRNIWPGFHFIYTTMKVSSKKIPYDELE